MKPRQAFIVRDQTEWEDLGISTVPEQALKGLSKLLDDMDPANPNRSSGGEVHLAENDTGKVYRLTFCDFTGLTICPFCHGTGAKPENAN